MLEPFAHTNGQTPSILEAFAHTNGQTLSVLDFYIDYHGKLINGTVYKTYPVKIIDVHFCIR